MLARARKYNKESAPQGKLSFVSPWAWVPTLYLAEGIPYFLVTSISVTLFAQLGVPNSEMALFTSLIAFPWVVKPLWSPFVDVLRTKRWWVLTMQVMMAVVVGLLAWLAPRGYFTTALILFTITAFCSATHDIAADGYYMLALDEKQQSAYVGLRSTFYRIANIFCQSILLMLVGWLQKKTDIATSWTYALLLCSGILAVMSVWHVWAMPAVEVKGERLKVKGILHEVGQVFAEFFKKPGIVLALLFCLVYILQFFGWVMQKATAPRAPKAPKPEKQAEAPKAVKSAEPTDEGTKAAIAMAIAQAGDEDMAAVAYVSVKVDSYVKRNNVPVLHESLF